MKNGDLFYWEFKNDAEYRKERSGSGTAYWALDRQCVYQDGEFYDTYSGRWDGEDFIVSDGLLNQDKINLTFKCNIYECEEVSKFEKDDYDKVYDCSYHSGYRKLYLIDKGVGKSKVAMKSKYLKKISEIEGDIKSLSYDLKYYKTLLNDLDN